MSTPTKAPKKTKAPKAETPVVAVAPPATVEAPVDNGVVSLAPETPLTDMFVSLNKTLQDLSTAIALVKSEVKVLEKHVTKELKVLDKMNAKKNKNKGNRAPSGFVKPTKISVELADFLSKPHGSLMARTDVTKQMTAYIRSNSLQDKTNGRIILPDPKLKKLLKLTDKDALTYFNLQKYMSPHFEKTVAA